MDPLLSTYLQLGHDVFVVQLSRKATGWAKKGVRGRDREVYMAFITFITLYAPIINRIRI